MKLLKIIEIADKVYPDGLIMQAYKAKGKRAGDGLAEFIVRELEDTYDSQAFDSVQLEDAAHAMRNAQRELGDVASAFLAQT